MGSHPYMLPIHRYQNGIKIAGLIYMHRITVNRMTRTLIEHLGTFRRLVGDVAMQNVMLTTTMWTALREKGIGLRREQELMKEHWKPMLESASRTARFEDTFESACAIIKALLSRGSYPTVLFLELVGLMR